MEERTQVVDGSKAELPDNGSQAAFKEIMLVIFKHDTHVGINVLLKKAIVLGENFCN
jgi:hypothetical protein